MSAHPTASFFARLGIHYAWVVAFVTFLAIFVWAYSRRNAARFDEAARLPFQDE